MNHPKLVLCHVSNSELGIQGCCLDGGALRVDPTTERQSHRTWHANNADLCHDQQPRGCFKAPQSGDNICRNCPSLREARGALSGLLIFKGQDLKLWRGGQVKAVGQGVMGVVPPVSEVAGRQQLGDVLTVLELQ